MDKLLIGKNNLFTAAAMSRPRLLIADDNEATRYLMKLLAEAECEVVGEAENGQEAVEAAERLCPDLVLLDVSMPIMGGFETARLLRQRMPELRIILTSQHAQRIYVDEALRLGVKGYVLKGACSDELVQAIREVLAGRLFRSPSIPS